MNYKAALVEAGKAMLQKGLTVETWGNLSLRDPETERVYLTPSAMPYEAITEEDVVVTGLHGELLEGRRKPTVEAGLHQAVYRARPEIQAVVHTHPVWSLVFAVLHWPIPPIIDEAAQVLGGAVRCAEYALPGTEALAQNAVSALGKEGMACLLANHGAVCLGADMAGAFKTAAVLEMTAQVYQLSLTAAGRFGKPVMPLQKKDVNALRNFMLHHYGQGK